MPPSPFFDTVTSLDALAERQGVTLLTDFEALFGDFWPEEESPDDFPFAALCGHTHARTAETARP